jgi:hypothetical protein
MRTTDSDTGEMGSVSARGSVMRGFHAREPTQDADRDGHAADFAVPGEAPTDFRPSTSYWRGKSGRMYRHSAHTTIFCPPPTLGVYVLARRDRRGRVLPLFAGVSASTAATLNLAKIRKRAALLGASEVHLCPVPTRGSVFSLRRVLRDLRAALPAAKPG